MTLKGLKGIIMSTITWSEKEGLQGCPCMDCKNTPECNPLGFCSEHAAWLESRKKAMHKELERLDRISRDYIKNLQS